MFSCSTLFSDHQWAATKKKLIETIFSFPAFTISYCITPCHCCALLFTCMLTCTHFLFHICACFLSITLTCSKSCNCSSLALVLGHTSFILRLFPQCFHTFNTFKPFVLHFFFCTSFHSVPHVQFSLFHYWIPGDIFAVLPSGSRGYYSSISLIVFMFLVQHQWWCD